MPSSRATLLFGIGRTQWATLHAAHVPGSYPNSFIPEALQLSHGEAETLIKTKSVFRERFEK